MADIKKEFVIDSEALRAAEIRAQESIKARVVDMFTVKPIDEECVIDCAKQTGAVVTAENCFINGSLGSAVCEVLCECCPTPVKRVGVWDEFGEVGSIDYLKNRFGLTAAHIVEAVKEVIAKK
ncbi:MAG: hypothetical protein LBR68_01705 [Lachnoclostridium sp.]|jgi:transketolase|nr:hypothetical protein [Lachnoclostridium sp.]